MRSIWNGSISFGLVNIPIKLMNATENHSVSFRQIHEEDGGRIRYRRVCELDEREVSTSEVGKAYEDVDGSMIPITDDDLAALPLPTAKTVEILAFTPAETIDPIQMETAYYLEGNGAPATKPYTLLREALRRSGQVAIAKYALRGRERLGVLRVVGDVIAMHGLLWPDEIRDAEGAAPEGDVAVRDAELDLADALMNTLGEVDLDSLHDDYREALEELISAKAEGRPAPKAPAAEEGGEVIDLMSALENSVRAAKQARGEEAPDGRAGADVRSLRPPPKKKAAAKRTTGRGAGESAGGRTGTGAKKAAKETAGTKKAAAAQSGAGVSRSGRTSRSSSTTAEKAPGSSASTGTAAKKQSRTRTKKAQPRRKSA